MATSCDEILGLRSQADIISIEVDFIFPVHSICHHMICEDLLAAYICHCLWSQRCRIVENSQGIIF